MKCLKCGAELQETDLFCPKCGEPVKKEKTNKVSEVNEVNNETNENMFTYERQTEDTQENNTQVNNANTNSTKTNNSQQKQTNKGGQAPKKKTNTGLIFLIVLIVIIALVAGIAYFVRTQIKKAAQNGFLSSLFGTENAGNINIDEGTLKDWIYGDGNEIDATESSILDALMGENGDDILNAILGGTDSNSISNNSITNSNSTPSNNTNSNLALNTTTENNSSTTTSQDTTQVDFEGYRINIPEKYTQTVIGGNTLRIQSAEESWVATFGVESKNVANYMEDSALMRSFAEQAFKKQGMTISNSGTTTINGVKFVVFEAKSGGENVDFAFVDKGDNNTFYMVLMASDLNKALNSISTLIKDAQYVGK